MAHWGCSRGAIPFVYIICRVSSIMASVVAITLGSVSQYGRDYTSYTLRYLTIKLELEMKTSVPGLLLVVVRKPCGKDSLQRLMNQDWYIPVRNCSTAYGEILLAHHPFTFSIHNQVPYNLTSMPLTTNCFFVAHRHIAALFY